MIKLTAPQQAVLIAAAAHPDGIATRPAGMKPSAAAKIAAKLVEHRLAREVRARDDVPAWHEDEQGRALSLKLLKAGHTLAAELLSAEQAADRQAASGQDGSATSAAIPTDQGAPVPVGSDGVVTGKGQTKRTLVLALLGRQGGATMDELIAATGWLPHTTRAALSILRKGGIALERGRRDDGATVWQVAAAAAPTAAAA